MLRALLLQVLYTVRSERLLMEELDYNQTRIENVPGDILGYDARPGCARS